MQIHRIPRMEKYNHCGEQAQERKQRGSGRRRELSQSVSKTDTV